jgi:aryl-alcohol dehydrogenase-like predicted oxidoreductase
VVLATKVHGTMGDDPNEFGNTRRWIIRDVENSLRRGPRTMEQLESQLPAAEVTLSGDVLDRIDELVPPGVNLNPADGGWQNPALEPQARRR